MNRRPENGKNALQFVLLLGLVSLFADVTYESARSISGPYLAILGANAAAVGFVAGFGEFIGFGLRIISGIIADRTRRYWLATIAGYTINLLAVPALALAGRWETAAILIMLERLGKAIRTPARDTLLSHASQSMGRGWAFGLHEAMDQVGAMAGPAIVAAILAYNGSYRYSFAVLAIPAILSLSVLVIARTAYPQPPDFETSLAFSKTTNLKPLFWTYLAGVALIALGFADFPLAAFHMKTTELVADKWIPLIYAWAMGVDAVSAILCGRIYDRKGFLVLPAMVVASACSAPMIFLSGPAWLIAGTACWGIGMGALESIIRAVVAEITPKDKRATGYGIFNAGFGLAWFLGSALMGILYDRSLMALAVFSAIAQLSSLPLLLSVNSQLKRLR
jgi:MFS family permease